MTMIASWLDPSTSTSTTARFRSASSDKSRFSLNPPRSLDHVMYSRKDEMIEFFYKKKLGIQYITTIVANTVPVRYESTVST